MEARPQAVLEVRLSGGRPRGAWRDVAREAEARGVVVVRGPRRPEQGRRSRKAEPGQGGRSGAAEAVVRERDGVSLRALWSDVRSEPGASGLWLALDRLQDPHNVGAIFRSAAFFGVRGIVVTRDQSAPLNSTVYDVASGGLEAVPFAQPPNLSRTLDRAKDAGLWVLGSSEHAEQDVREMDRDRPWLLVLGSEERGLRRLTLEKCDVVCRLTPRGSVTSLNASVAAGVLMAALAGQVE